MPLSLTLLFWLKFYKKKKNKKKKEKMFDLFLSNPTWTSAVEGVVRSLFPPQSGCAPTCCWSDRKLRDLVVELTWILLKPPLCFLTERITCREKNKTGEWGRYADTGVYFSPYRCGSYAARFDGRHTCSCISWRCWWSRSLPPRSWDWSQPTGVKVAGLQVLNFQ